MPELEPIPFAQTQINDVRRQLLDAAAFGKHLRPEHLENMAANSPKACAPTPKPSPPPRPQRTRPPTAAPASTTAARPGEDSGTADFGYQGADSRLITMSRKGSDKGRGRQ
ncbi:DUF6374 family protein [Nocardia asiatica]|uniref:DUF6374 family protein n=1 Tax=Nocardia asiatica TaxID=209252 RepID=UPI003EE265EF